MKLAAIDIGSNAIRFQLSSVLQYQEEIIFKKLEYIRFPLRLGHDTFTKRTISAESEQKFMKLLQAFKLLLELYEVKDYMACATSAMREADNGQRIADRVRKEVGLNIEIIDGEKEAELISNSIRSYIDEKNYLHIDVGGGSTELNFYSDRKKVSCKSFKIGSVRTLEHSFSPEAWKEMESWIKSQIQDDNRELIAIGTGGNINKLYDLTKKKSKKTLSLNQLINMKKFIERFTYSERVNFLKLNEDRADVIIPASEIYLTTMKWANAKTMLVPDTGLKDGMVQLLFERNQNKEDKKIKRFSFS
ncbi:MAG TPA: phosphatase [Cytophagales bacterium]|nr:phosphatase [Cytophagales bacterium]